METEEKKTDEGRRLTPAQWEEIKTLWELGEVTLADLSARFGISNSALSQGLKRRGATRASRAREVASAIAEKAITSAAESSFGATKHQRIEETKRQHYEWSMFVAKAGMSRLAAAQKDGRPFSTEHANLKALRLTSAILKDTLDQRYQILDVQNEIEDGALPVLEIVGMDEERIHQIREAQDLGDDDLLPSLDPELEEIIEDDGTS